MSTKDGRNVFLTVSGILCGQENESSKATGFIPEREGGALRNAKLTAAVLADEFPKNK